MAKYCYGVFTEESFGDSMEFLGNTLGFYRILKKSLRIRGRVYVSGKGICFINTVMGMNTIFDRSNINTILESHNSFREWPVEALWARFKADGSAEFEYSSDL